MNDDDQSLVSPRYTAGAGPVQDATGPLIHLFGLSCIHNSTTGRITATGPDKTTIFKDSP